MMNPKVTAIIPAHNEDKTIGDVVRIVKASEPIKEVIVVSDGSRDRTVREAKMAGARVVALNKKQGKGQAMLAGLKQSNSQVVLFLDADLIGLTQEHVERLVYPVVNGVKSMNVGMIDRGRVGNFIARHCPLISGERALKREIVEAVPKEFMNGFMVENSLNYYCRTRKLGYGAIHLPGLSIRRKYDKVPLSEAVVQYLKMTFEILKGMFIVRIAYLIKRF